MGQLLDYFNDEIQPEMDKLEYLQIIAEVIEQEASGEITNEDARYALADIICDNCTHNEYDVNDYDEAECSLCGARAVITDYYDEDDIKSSDLDEWDTEDRFEYLIKKPLKDLVGIATKTIKSN